MFEKTVWLFEDVHFFSIPSNTFSNPNTFLHIFAVTVEAMQRKALVKIKRLQQLFVTEIMIWSRMTVIQYFG